MPRPANPEGAYGLGAYAGEWYGVAGCLGKHLLCVSSNSLNAPSPGQTHGQAVPLPPAEPESILTRFAPGDLSFCPVILMKIYSTNVTIQIYALTRGQSHCERVFIQGQHSVLAMYWVLIIVKSGPIISTFHLLLLLTVRDRNRSVNLLGLFSPCSSSQIALPLLEHHEHGNQLLPRLHGWSVTRQGLPSLPVEATNTGFINHNQCCLDPAQIIMIPHLVVAA